MARSLADIELLFKQASSMRGVARKQFLSSIEPLELRVEVEDLLGHSDAGETLTTELENAVNSAVGALLDTFEDPRIGRTIGRFEVRSILGDGGSTRVYLAFDPALQREVAIKVLSTSSGLSDERFMIEARAISSLSHPHIGLVYEIGESQGGDRYLVMPFYSGPTLAAELKDGCLPTTKALDIAEQLAHALCSAHEAGIVHRDVKAANVIFESSDSVRLLDFGIAKLTESERTEQNVIVGTVAYMSPEQTRGSGVDERTDVWSLGVLLYEMLSGRKPFSGDRVEAVIHQIRHDKAPDLPSLPHPLRNVLDRALAKDPAERFESMAAFRDAIIQSRSSLDTGVNLRQFQPSRLPRPGWLAIAGSVAAILAIIVGAYLLVTEGPSRTQQVAVMPFVTSNSGADNGYLGEGISGQLRDQLGGVEGLSVVGRDSSLNSRFQKMDPAAVAAALEARWLITGEVSRQEEGLRLRLHILDGESGRQVWSRDYDQTTDGLLSVQNRLIDDAVRQLLGVGRESTAGSDIAVNNEAAFSLMLEANNYFNNALDQDIIDGQQLDRSISLYRQALELDPDSALLNTRLAAALLYKGSVSEAQFYIEHAQASGENLSQVEHTVGLYLYARHADGVGDHLKRAVELNPSDAEALEDYGLYLYAQARVAAARTYLERAHMLDPMSIRRYEALGNFYGTNGFYEEAQQLVQKIADRFDTAASRLVISRIYEVMGDLDKAIAWSILASEHATPDSASRWRIAELYTRVGDYDTALKFDPEQSVAMLYFSRQYDALIEMAFNLVLEDRSSAALFTLARAYAATDRSDIAIRLMGTQDLPDRLYRDSATVVDIEAGVMLADALMDAGNQGEAQNLVTYLTGMFRRWAAAANSWQAHVNLACLLSISGEQELALAELEKIPGKVGLPWYPVLSDQPCFRKRLAGNPRYEAILESVVERKRKLREVLPSTLQQAGISQQLTGIK